MAWYTKLFKLIAMVLAVIALVYAIAAIIAFASTAAAGTLGGSWLGLGLGLSPTGFMVIAIVSGVISAAISPEGFHTVIDPVVDGVAEVAGTVVSAALDVGGSVLSNFSGWLWVGLGVVGLSVFTS